MPTRTRFLLVLAAMALVLLGTFWTPVAGVGRWTGVVLTTGHGVAFAMTAALAAFLLAATSMTRKWPVWLQYAAVLVFTALLGSGTEILQIWLPRDANLEDLRTDVLGAWLGLAAFAVFDARLRIVGRIGASFSGLIPFFVLAVPLATCIQAYVRRGAAFPVLADYGEAFDDYFLQAQGTSRTHELMPEAWSAYPGEQAMRITFGKVAWPGLHFAEPSPDWRGYETLALDVTNPNPEALPLSIRIHDRAHNNQYSDRFNTLIDLAGRERSVVRLPVIEISRGPRARNLDIDEISGLILFVSGNTEPERIGRGLLVSRIWLE